MDTGSSGGGAAEADAEPSVAVDVDVLASCVVDAGSGCAAADVGQPATSDDTVDAKMTGVVLSALVEAAVDNGDIVRSSSVVAEDIVVVVTAVPRGTGESVLSCGREAGKDARMEDATTVTFADVEMMVVGIHADVEVVMSVDVLVVVRRTVVCARVGGSKFASALCTGRSRNSGHRACTTPMRERGTSKMISL